MSTPVDEDQNSEYLTYIPKRSRDQAQIPSAPQLRVPSASTSSEQLRVHTQPREATVFEGDLANDVARELYDRRDYQQSRPKRRRHSLPNLISWLLVILACAALIVIVATIGWPLWESLNAERNTFRQAREAFGLSGSLATSSTPSIDDTTRGYEGQQSSSVQPQSTPLVRRFEQTSMRSPVQGVTKEEIRFGISAPFSGPAKELGHHMKIGIEAAFNMANANGGVHARQLRLVAVDDGYEPARTAETMRQLYERDRVFGIIGNVGTPTAVVALPYALERRMLFYGAFTGAGLLRRDPPDRYVFNYRASYAEETDAMVRYLVKVRRIRPEQIAVFAQQDSYGDAGFAGVARAIRSLRGGDESTILRLNYKRNTADVDEAVALLQRSRIPIKAVIMVPTYRAAARFIEKTRDFYPGLIYTNVSFVGSTALASEMMLLGQKYVPGIIVTQVVPAVDDHSSLVLDYKSALMKHFPGEPPDYVSLEGYVAAVILIEALKRNGPQLDTESLVETLEKLRDFDLGLGTPVTFGRTEHQAVHKVWGTELDANGRYQAIELQ